MSETAARRAVLFLHGLELSVQRAVLAKLTPTEAERLQPLLSELQAAADLPAREAIVAALADWAPTTIAALMQARDWPWKAQVLAHLPEPARGAVSECMRQDAPKLAPAAVRRLCDRICERVERTSAWSR